MSSIPMPYPAEALREQGQRPSLHDKINKHLQTIALVLGILLMASALYVGAEVAYKYLQLQDALADIGADPVEEAEPEGFPSESEVPDLGRDLTPFYSTPLGEETSDGTVCEEDAKVNAITCTGPSADDGEVYWNGVVID